MQMERNGLHLTSRGVGLSLTLVFAASPAVQAQSVAVGTYIEPANTSADPSHPPSIERRSLDETVAAKLPVGSVLYAGDRVYIRWMEAKLRFCPKGDQTYGRSDKDETQIVVPECPYTKNRDLPAPGTTNLYLHASLPPIPFDRALKEANSLTGTFVGYPETSEPKKHRLYLVHDADDLSNIAALYGVTMDSLWMQNSGGFDLSIIPGNVLKIPLVAEKLNWPLVGTLNPDLKDGLEFKNVGGAAVYATGIGIVTVKKEADDHSTVEINHQNGFVSVLQGLTDVQKQTGDMVDADDLLGKVADKQFGFQVLEGGQKINPFEVLPLSTDAPK